MTKGPTLLIDGDHALYVATVAVEREVQWDEHNHVLYSNFEEAMATFSRRIEGLKRDLKAVNVYLAFSGGENFRYTVYPDYKDNRTNRKPLCYKRCVEAIFKQYTAKSVPCLEADDLLGIWATNGKIKDPIIVSEDKDLQTIPGRLYRQGNLHTITQEAADTYWLTQTLTGDATDGYPGLPGCGAVTAAKFLDGTNGDVSRMWKAVVDAYAKKGLTEDDALTQARLARILRNEDWNSKEQKVKLWTPTNIH